jgi:phosphotransferase system HPr-like phosphotransfer protein
MRSVYINLPSVNSVQKFVATVSKLEGDFDFQSGNYILDARSLMGIFTLDLTKPVKLNVQNDTEETMQALSSFLEESR